MIINLLQDKTNIININYSDEVSDNLISSNFTCKSYSDIISWKVYNPIINCIQFSIISNSVSNLRDINYSISNIEFWDTLSNLKIETSLDYINWQELPYKNEFGYYFHNTDSSIYYYNNYEFKMIRFTFNNINGNLNENNVIKFNELQILIDESFDIAYVNKKLLSTRSSMFGRPKIYYDYPFLPDMITSFMEMLERNNSLDISNEYKIIDLNPINNISVSSDSSIVLTVSANYDSGTYNSPFYANLSTNLPATIYYTLDGTEPNENSNVFSTAILIE